MLFENLRFFTLNFVYLIELASFAIKGSLLSVLVILISNLCNLLLLLIDEEVKF